jgi:hypothetical protein
MSESTSPERQAVVTAERLTELSDDDLAVLCEAADAAIIDGGGFGWLAPPGRTAMERYFRGVLLVPERAAGGFGRCRRWKRAVSNSSCYCIFVIDAESYAYNLPRMKTCSLNITSKPIIRI